MCNQFGLQWPYVVIYTVNFSIWWESLKSPLHFLIDSCGKVLSDLGLNENNNSAADDVIYNLQGQKVGKGNTSNLPQGVYIKNGKKIVVE